MVFIVGVVLKNKQITKSRERTAAQIRVSVFGRFAALSFLQFNHFASLEA